MCRFLFMFLGDFWKLNKTLSDGTLLGECPGGFFDVGCCFCFISLEVFTFACYFSLPPALHPDFSGPWRPPPALSSTLATFGYFTFARIFRHSFTASSTVLSRRFLLTCVLYLALLPHILARFCDSDVDRSISSRILLCSCSHKVAPSAWRMVFNCSYCWYKTIGLPIAPVSH